MACNHCSGNCANCSGCSSSLELTQGELHIINSLAQYSFLPVARRADDMTPVYLEEHAYTSEEYSLILQCLEKKGLIVLDYHRPLIGADMSAYNGYPVHGTMSLTQQGLHVVELLEIQGFAE